MDWVEFNAGLLIGMQISDKTRFGYNVGDNIKPDDVEYYAGYWTILR